MILNRYATLSFVRKDGEGAGMADFLFESVYSPEFNQVYLFCRPISHRAETQVVVIIEPSEQNQLRVSFASQIVRLADVDVSSCVPMLRLAPFDKDVEWRFVDYLSLLVRRKLAQWFKQTFGYEAVPEYAAIKSALGEIISLPEEGEVVHYLFSDDLDLVGLRQQKKLCFLERVWRECRSFFR